MGKRVRAYIGLGANVGDARANLDRAINALAALPGVHVRAVSPLYRSKPVGVLDQPDFVNAVAAIDVRFDADADAAALHLLGRLKQIERDLGRRKRERWGPREIDLDLLVFGRQRIDAPSLTVPHPRMAERLFVLAPLANLAPGLLPPGWRHRVSTAAAKRREVEGADAVERMGWRLGFERE